MVLRSARPLGMDVKGSPVRLGGQVDCMIHFQSLFTISPRLRASRPPIIEPPRLECWTPPELLHALGSVLCARVDMIFAAPALTCYPNSKRPPQKHIDMNAYLYMCWFESPTKLTSQFSYCPVRWHSFQLI